MTTISFFSRLIIAVCAIALTVGCEQSRPSAKSVAFPESPPSDNGADTSAGKSVAGSGGAAEAQLIQLAREGNVSAQEALSIVYGDPELPLSRLIEEARSGNPAAQFHLAGRYARGEGVPKNLPEAGRLLIASARQNFHAAQYALGVACLRASEDAAGSHERETGIALLSCVAASESPLADAARSRLNETRTPPHSVSPSSVQERNLTVRARLENLELYRDYKRARKLEEDQVREMEHDRNTRQALADEEERNRNRNRD